jgi:hypothetical protein
LRFGKAKMSANESAGNLFIRESTILPGGLIIETETILPGWRAVRNCDGYRLGRKIEEANWKFFYLAGEARTIVFGRLGPGSLRRAVRSIVAKPEARNFNSVEVTGAHSSRFLGIPFVRVTANFRHIQQGPALARANDSTPSAPAAPEGAMPADKFGTFVSSS